AAVAPALATLFSFHRVQLFANWTASLSLRPLFSRRVRRTLTSIKRTNDVSEFNLSAYLKECFVQHAAAIEEFRPFVSKERIPSYQRAWEQYLELDPTHWTGMAEFMAEHVNPENPLKVIRARIEALLSYSET
ncbi:hypothetical protein, partial [Methylibium rhizosphaerae]|uniref:hypothetical protein n=1 Tax=Methylibium rhizosphaerae TaxID=2570323 RepID=UPI0015E2C8BA